MEAIEQATLVKKIQSERNVDPFTYEELRHICANHYLDNLYMAKFRESARFTRERRALKDIRDELAGIDSEDRTTAEENIL